MTFHVVGLDGDVDLPVPAGHRMARVVVALIGSEPAADSHVLLDTQLVRRASR